jgi:hexosaminidase
MPHQLPSALFLRVFAVVLGLSQLGSCLWPIPRKLQSGTTFLKISPSFNISVSTSGCANEPPQDLLDAVTRTEQFIQTDALQRLVPGRGADDASAVQSAATLSALKLSLSCTSGSGFRSITEEAQAQIDDREEGYSLTVPADGTAASLSANSTLGLFRGLTTFSQLWYDLGGTTYTNVAPVTISNDSPAYVRDSQWYPRSQH